MLDFLRGGERVCVFFFCFFFWGGGGGGVGALTSLSPKFPLNTNNFLPTFGELANAIFNLITLYASRVHNIMKIFN